MSAHQWLGREMLEERKVERSGWANLNVVELEASISEGSTAGTFAEKVKVHRRYFILHRQRGGDFLR